MKNQKGITLIALVITIIVLLILAGVSIAMLTGQNGILTQAQNASDATIKGEAEEAVKLAINTIMANQSAAKAGVNANTTVTNITELTAANIVTVIQQNNGSCYAAVGTAGDAEGSTPVTIIYKNNDSANKQVTVSVANGMVTGSVVSDVPTT